MAIIDKLYQNSSGNIYSQFTLLPVTIHVLSIKPNNFFSTNRIFFFLLQVSWPTTIQAKQKICMQMPCRSVSQPSPYRTEEFNVSQLLAVIVLRNHKIVQAHIKPPKKNNILYLPVRRFAIRKLISDYPGLIHYPGRWRRVIASGRSSIVITQRNDGKLPRLWEKKISAARKHCPLFSHRATRCM